MHRPSRDSLLLCSTNQGIHQSETVYLRLQVVVEHRLEGGHLRIHDHDILCDAVATQCDALVGHSNRQIVHTVVLQCLGHFHSSCTVGVGLHHAHQLRLGFQERAVVVQVVDHRIQVHLQNGLVHFLFQLLRNMIEAKDA